MQYSVYFRIEHSNLIDWFLVANREEAYIAFREHIRDGDEYVYVTEGDHISYKTILVYSKTHIHNRVADACGLLDVL